MERLRRTKRDEIAGVRVSLRTFVSKIDIHFRDENVFLLRGRVEKEALQRGCRSSARDDFRVCARGQRFDVVEQRAGRILQNQFGLIFHREQIVQPAFAHEPAVGQNPNSIADLLSLREKVRGKQDRYSSPPKIDNQIAKLAAQ